MELQDNFEYYSTKSIQTSHNHIKIRLSKYLVMFLTPKQVRLPVPDRYLDCDQPLGQVSLPAGFGIII